MLGKVKIWSWKHATKNRIWYYKCRECAKAPQASRNFFSVGMSTRWEWVLEDANQHLEMYH